MKIYKYPDKKEWNQILQRPLLESENLEQKVLSIINEVKANGDDALMDFTKRFDGVSQETIRVSEAQVEDAVNRVDEDLKKAIGIAVENIKKFHKAQKQEIQKIETSPGVVCWQKSVAIEKVGLYVPGGSAPLFSTVLMLGIPAVVAGCSEIVLCTPPGKDGSINDVILYSAKLVGIDKIYKVGGAQAIAGMAYGTESVPQVNKIFGPGNQYVTAAKQIVARGLVGIDMPAGPSEVAVMADESANPEFIASDLLSQAEHGADSQVILVTTSEGLIPKVETAVDTQLKQLSRNEIASKALENSRIILVRNDVEMLNMINTYAPEHLIIATKNAEATGNKIINAGSVFLGNYTPESAGDYASGTNHTLPTYGYAKVYNGVNLDDYVKKITFQEISKDGILALGPVIEKMATAEQLTAHANAVRLRRKE